MSNVLELPEHPSSNTTWFCLTQAKDIVQQLRYTGLDPDAPLGPNNPNRITVEYLQPLLDNLKDVTDDLADRAQQAEDSYLKTPTDIEFDHVQLGDVIGDIRRSQEEVNYYQGAVSHAASMSVDEQREWLTDFVFAPVFHGSGFQTPGDETTPWVHGQPLWCTPLIHGTALETSVGWHVKKWKKMARKSQGTQWGKVLLGFATIAGTIWVVNKYRSTKSNSNG